MQSVEETLDDPADHLALDEALLLESKDAIRIWEFSQPVVIAGRSSRIDDEIDREYCQAAKIPILRRCTGGAAVVGGPGCLMYSVVLNTDDQPQLHRIDAAHQHVMTRVLHAMQIQIPETRWQGICDLTWRNKKFSGNSLRITRDSLLYHGTILYDFDLNLIARCLCAAPRQPDYRAGRDHESFVTNVPIDPERLKADLLRHFHAAGKSCTNALLPGIRQLRTGRYDLDAWNFRH